MDRFHESLKISRNITIGIIVILGMLFLSAVAGDERSYNLFETLVRILDAHDFLLIPKEFVALQIAAIVIAFLSPFFVYVFLVLIDQINKRQGASEPSDQARH